MKKHIIILLLCLLVLPLVSAWGPRTHTFITDNLYEEGTSDVISLCQGDENEAAFRLGSMTPDITVIYYFVEGGNKYRGTHNWNFQEEVMAQATTDDERCFGWGIAAHLIADSVSHTKVIPKSIQKTKIPNRFIHLITEQTFDSLIAIADETTVEDAKHMMDALYGLHGDRYIEMVEHSLGENNIYINVEDHMNKLAAALGGFYGEAYSMGGWMFSIYPKISNFLYKVTPYIGVSDLGETKYYIGQSSDLADTTFTNWGARFQISPHGFEQLNAADQLVGNFYWVIIIITFSPIAIAYYKRNPKYLLLIPLFAIVTFFIISNFLA